MTETSCEVEISQEFNIKHRRKLTVVFIRCCQNQTIVGPIWGHKLPLLVLEGVADLDEQCSCGGWHKADTQYREEIAQFRERLEALEREYNTADLERAKNLADEAVQIEEQILAIQREALPWT